MKFKPSRLPNLSRCSWLNLSHNWEWLGLSGICIAALILFGLNLGETPLRDWDEGIVASVAREIWRSYENGNHWLYPTINGGQPYWNKPPLVHWLIACSYSWFGINEFSTRIVPAMLSALSVPLLYGIGKEIFTDSKAVVFSTLVYLTLLPVARHGRLAMLDGAIVCFLNLTVWCLLRSRRHLRNLLGVGLGLGLICLTKGIMMGLLLGAILILFLAWDCPRLLKNSWFWQAIIIGIIPVLLWYGLQYLRYGQAFLGISLGDQTFSRIWSSVNERQGAPWYYLLEILKYTFPWLLFLPGGILTAFTYRSSSWAKLALVWSGVYLVTISLMATKLPWYIFPIYPALSLLIGVNLAKIWHSGRRYPIIWSQILRLSKTETARTGVPQAIIFIILSLACYLASIWFGLVSSPPDYNLLLVLGIMALTLTIATVMLLRQSRQFIVTLFIGLYVALLLFFSGFHWVWELAEAYPVKPIAAMLKQATPSQQIIYTSYPYHRPSLNFYSDRVIIPTSHEELINYWQQEQSIYFLIEPSLSEQLHLEGRHVLGTVDHWQLITKKNCSTNCY
ncbi:ArnT family glycosyltransferase [Stanieria cyanosphaera]|uniref:ArnT family glycosyltransferase n=1 Tax=Stanieria cyanosphaera TaxID=102116 RepID=UPI001C0A8633|nr:glycosyltransferase family 39 protein [Stanieria cyanosphaera]